MQRFLDNLKVCNIIPNISRINLVNELKDKIRETKVEVIPHKFFYYDLECSYNWIKLMGDTTNYPLAYQTRNMLQINFERIINIIKEEGSPHFDLLSLGVGDGYDDLRMLESIRKILFGDDTSRNKITYYPVDISYDLINNALNLFIDRIPGFVNKRMEIIILNSDFEKLSAYNSIINRYSRNPKLITLLGSTLGNFYELTLMRAIQSLMNNDDYLLIGVDCCYENQSIDKIIKKNSESTYGLQFLLGPLRSLDTIQIEGDTIHIPSMAEDQITTNTSDQPLTSLPPSEVATIIHSINLGNHKILLTMSHKYKIQPLIDFFRTLGLTLVEKFIPSHSENCNYCLFLLKFDNSTKSDYEEQSLIETVRGIIDKDPSNIDKEKITNKVDEISRYLKNPSTPIDQRNQAIDKLKSIQSNGIVNHDDLAEILKIFRSRQ